MAVQIDTGDLEPGSQENFDEFQRQLEGKTKDPANFDTGSQSERLLGEDDPDPGKLFFGGSEEAATAAQKAATKAVAGATTGREAAQGGIRDDINQSLDFADMFSGDAQAGAAGMDRAQLRRLTQRAQGIGVSPGEMSLNRAISAGAAGQRSAAAGAAPGGLITGARQAGRATARGTRGINRGREVTKLRDQFAAQDQLTQVLSQQRGQQQGRAGVAAQKGIDMGRLQGGALGGAFNAGIGRELGLRDVQLNQLISQLGADVNLEGLLAQRAPDQGILGSLFDAAGSALASAGGGFGGGGGGGNFGMDANSGVTGSDATLDSLGFTGNNGVSNDDLLNQATVL